MKKERPLAGPDSFRHPPPDYRINYIIGNNIFVVNVIFQLRSQLLSLTG